MHVRKVELSWERSREPRERQKKESKLSPLSLTIRWCDPGPGQSCHLIPRNLVPGREEERALLAGVDVILVKMGP